MHNVNPTRRSKRFKRPLSQLPDTSDVRPGGDDLTGRSNHVRHRRAVQPNTLRGTILVAVIVVTIVLYIMLWELERSSFASVPIDKPNLDQSAMVAPPSSGISETISTDGPVLPSGKGSSFPDNWIAVPPDAWPPPIIRVPEEHDTDDDQTHEDESTKPSSFDAAYCNGACRFLLPARVGEQESKARVHLMQLMMLARRLDRTIVLPNVGKSRMSACSKWSFGAYYDTDAFVHAGDSPDPRPAMVLEGFSKWVYERPRPPSSFVVSMHSIHQAQTVSEDVLFIVERAEVDPKILSCLESKLARLRSSLPEMALSISFDSGSLKAESAASTRVVQLLSSSLDMDTDSGFDEMTGLGYEYTLQYTNASYLSLADADVLVLDYDLRHPLFATSLQPDFNLHYAPLLYDLADRLSDNLGPFLGVHWRMENIPVQNLAWCATSLVSTLHALLQDDVTGKNVQHVWLATDHPRPLSSFVDGVHFPADNDQTSNASIGIGKDRSPRWNDGPIRKSSTFKKVSSEHDDAIGILADALQPGGDLESWKLTDLAEQLRRYPYVEGKFHVDETLLDDPGVLGILDKLVIVQARAFVSGSTDCSKTSSFSQQVIQGRQESFEAERVKGAIRNVVEYFGTR